MTVLKNTNICENQHLCCCPRQMPKNRIDISAIRTPQPNQDLDIENLPVELHHAYNSRAFILFTRHMTLSLFRENLPGYCRHFLRCKWIHKAV